jgi:alcohol dehydrogenase class IV
MRNFNYYHPTRIQFGKERISEVGKIVARNGKKCLLVTVKSFPLMSDLFEKVKNLCEKAGIETIHYDGATPEPNNDCVNNGSKIARENNVDVILGVGGGSTMDTAKAISVGVTHEGDIWDYRLGQKRVGKNVLPVIAVPTTGGTGAEVTNMAVIKNAKDKTKSAIASWDLTPRVAVVDPILTLSAPPNVTASTGFDAFTHSFETFINTNSSNFIDLYALDALKKIIKYLPIVVEDGSNLEAREALSFAAMLGGLCISNIGTTLPHGMAMALGGHASGIAHGESLAILYPEISRWTWMTSIEKFAEVGRLFDHKLNEVSDKTAAEKCCDEIETFIKKIGLWSDALNLRNYTLHPKIANHDDLINLFEKSYKRK